MSDRTGIEWTDATWNPIRGCSRVSSGCINCYAEREAARHSGPGEAYDGLARFVTTRDGRKEARWTGEIRFVDHALHHPLRWSEPRLIFVNSMSDLFHEKVTTEMVDRIVAVMALSPHHVFQVLTKRPERMRDYLRDPAMPDRVRRTLPEFSVFRSAKMRHADEVLDKPLANVWWGVSAEDQATAQERLPILRETPAAVAWVSAEPLIGSIDLSMIGTMPGFVDNPLDGGWLDWVVVGGESGPEARPMLISWAKLLRDQCADADIPFLFKQHGNWIDADEWLRAQPAADLKHIGQGRPLSSPLNFTDGEKVASYYRYDYEHHSDGTTMMKVGKRTAGRLLEGRFEDGYPPMPEEAEAELTLL